MRPFVWGLPWVLLAIGYLVLGLLTPTPPPRTTLAQELERHAALLLDPLTEMLARSQQAAVQTVLKTPAPMAPVVPEVPAAPPSSDPATDRTAPDDMTLRRTPSISPQEIDGILAEYGSPAQGSGQKIYDLGIQYGIDPAYALAFFIHESSAGTAGAAVETRSWGNIECAGYPTCNGRWRSYTSWEEGAEDWYRLIDAEYIQGRGITTVAEVIPVYAPSTENDVQAYIATITDMVAGWRRIFAIDPAVIHDLVPIGPADAPQALWPIEGGTINAGFYDQNCTDGHPWKSQSWTAPDGKLWTCIHVGLDIGDLGGDKPVRLPVDCFYLTMAASDGYGGGHFMCTTYDGFQSYLGHLRDIVSYDSGAMLPKGTVIGYTTVYRHTHWQLKDPGGNLVDPLQYYTDRGGVVP
jgi:hypothetical protein